MHYLYIDFVGSFNKAKSKLPKAIITSDISTTEDETIKDKTKYYMKRHSSNPNEKFVKKLKLNSANQSTSSPSLLIPPLYNHVKGRLSNLIYNLFYF